VKVAKLIGGLRCAHSQVGCNFLRGPQSALSGAEGCLLWLDRKGSEPQRTIRYTKVERQAIAFSHLGPKWR
jgi:hypothetical protein